MSETTTPTTTRRAAELLVGACRRLTEAGIDPATISQAAFACAFQMGYAIAPASVVYAQLRQALDELERAPDYPLSTTP